MTPRGLQTWLYCIPGHNIQIICKIQVDWGSQPWLRSATKLSTSASTLLRVCKGLRASVVDFPSNTIILPDFTASSRAAISKAFQPMTLQSNRSVNFSWIIPSFFRKCGWTSNSSVFQTDSGPGSSSAKHRRISKISSPVREK